MKAGGDRLAPRGGCHSLDENRADLIEYLKEESRR